MWTCLDHYLLLFFLYVISLIDSNSTSSLVSLFSVHFYSQTNQIIPLIVNRMNVPKEEWMPTAFFEIALDRLLSTGWNPSPVIWFTVLQYVSSDSHSLILSGYHHPMFSTVTTLLLLAYSLCSVGSMAFLMRFPSSEMPVLLFPTL